MRERLEPLLRVVCLGLGLLLAVQLVRVILRSNPLGHVVIPQVPTLAAKTEEASENPSSPPHANGVTGTATNAISGTQSGKSGTNGSALQAGSNAVAATRGSHTNKPSSAASNAPMVAAAEPGAQAATNTSSKREQGINARPEAPTSPSQGKMRSSTNVVMAGTNHSTRTNLAASDMHGTNHETGSNLVALGTNGAGKARAHGTNSQNHAVAGPAGMMPPGAMMPGGRPGMPPKAAELPPEIMARVDRVVDSELLGPVFHPMPASLMGIAGDFAFLRGPTGQTGLVKVGDSLGEIKLLKIGINRVLIEENGEKKELMIFAGLGGESLLPK